MYLTHPSRLLIKSLKMFRFREDIRVLSLKNLSTCCVYLQENVTVRKIILSIHKGCIMLIRFIRRKQYKNLVTLLR